MTRLWIVRAGKQGDRELAAIEHGRLLPGFLEVGEGLTPCASADEDADAEDLCDR